MHFSAVARYSKKLVRQDSEFCVQDMALACLDSPAKIECFVKMLQVDWSSPVNLRINKDNGLSHMCCKVFYLCIWDSCDSPYTGTPAQCMDISDDGTSTHGGSLALIKLSGPLIGLSVALIPDLTPRPGAPILLLLVKVLCPLLMRLTPKMHLWEVIHPSATAWTTVSTRNSPSDMRFDGLGEGTAWRLLWRIRDCKASHRGGLTHMLSLPFGPDAGYLYPL